MVSIDQIVRELRSYRGVTRKAEVSSLAHDLLTEPEGSVIATYAEDAAAIEMNGQILLLAADGIMEDLVRADPYWAGYCSVLVNVNDIAAMGGAPLALVDVMSCGDPGVRREISRGMKAASEKTGVPIVGGHLHPDTSYYAIDVAVLGETDRAHLVLSSGAKPDDSIVFVMDLDGSFTPGIPYSWDTTSAKEPGDVRRGLMAMHAIAPMVTAGKDISCRGLNFFSPSSSGRALLTSRLLYWITVGSISGRCPISVRFFSSSDSAERFSAVRSRCESTT